MKNVSDGIWAYDVGVLVVLVFPFLAAVFVFVLGTHWKVQSWDAVLGYDPVVIARRVNDVLGSSGMGRRRYGGGSSCECLGMGKVGRGRIVV